MMSFPPTHYADWFRRHAQTRGNAVALWSPAGRLTYAGFDRALHACAYRLSESGIGRGQTLALCVENPILHCVLIAALNRMGCATLALARPLKAGVAIAAPEGLAIDRIIVEQPFAGVAPEQALSVAMDWLATDKEATREWQGPGLVDSNALAHIFTSSGTTGALKAVGFSMAQIEARLFRRSIGILSTGRSGHSLSCFGLGSTIGFQAVFATLWAGGTAFAGFPEAAVPRLIARQKIERMEGSPAQYQEILRRGSPAEHDLSSLRYAVIGGATVGQPLVAAVRRRLCAGLIGQYGATEVGMVSFGPLKPSNPAGYCGHLVPWMEREAVDADGKALPAGTEGILRFRCEEMAHGYLNDSAATAGFFRDGWFYPGDLGAIGPDRTLRISGRSAERINAGGVKVAPELIERTIMEFGGIEECAAFGVADKLGVERIWAALVASGPLDLAALRRHCATKLGDSGPKEFLTLMSLPRTPNGKIRRPELQKLAASASPAKIADA